MIPVLPKKGTDPFSVVRSALQEKNKARLSGHWNEKDGDTAWAVFDGDEHIIKSPDKWNEAIQLAGREKINLSISNPCFELWVLLHYRDQAANINNDRANSLLKTHLPDYEKPCNLYPDPLMPLTLEAILRAKRLEEKARRDELPSHTNPCTGVAALVELLLTLKR
jgi:hypothetical protein